MKKGLNATITLIIAIIVMVIVALALIAVTTGNLGSFGKDASDKVSSGMNTLDKDSTTMKKIKCNSMIANKASTCSAIDSNCYWSDKLKKCYWSEMPGI